MQRVAKKVKDATRDILDIDVGEDPTTCESIKQILLLHRCGGLGV